MTQKHLFCLQKRKLSQAVESPSDQANRVWWEQRWPAVVWKMLEVLENGCSLYTHLDFVDEVDLRFDGRFLPVNGQTRQCV